MNATNFERHRSNSNSLNSKMERKFCVTKFWKFQDLESCKYYDE